MFVSSRRAVVRRNPLCTAYLLFCALVLLRLRREWGGLSESVLVAIVSIEVPP